jgi:hypothetical protein
MYSSTSSLLAHFIQAAVETATMLWTPAYAHVWALILEAKGQFILLGCQLQLISPPQSGATPFSFIGLVL